LKAKDKIMASKVVLLIFLIRIITDS